jgi:hypothetical protein
VARTFASSNRLLILRTLFAHKRGAQSPFARCRAVLIEAGRTAMKLYLLLTLMGMFVGISWFPLPAKPNAAKANPSRAQRSDPPH